MLLMYIPFYCFESIELLLVGKMHQLSYLHSQSGGTKFHFSLGGHYTISGKHTFEHDTGKVELTVM